MIVRHVGLSAFFSMLSGDVTGRRGRDFFWFEVQKSVAIF